MTKTPTESSPPRAKTFSRPNRWKTEVTYEPCVQMLKCIMYWDTVHRDSRLAMISHSESSIFVVKDVNTSLLGIKVHTISSHTILGGIWTDSYRRHHNVSDVENTSWYPYWVLMMHDITLDQEFLGQFPTILVDKELFLDD